MLDAMACGRGPGPYLTSHAWYLSALSCTLAGQSSGHGQVLRGERQVLRGQRGQQQYGTSFSQCDKNHRTGVVPQASL